MLASSRRPRAAARSRGRAMALPYKPWKMPRQTGTAATTRTNVGRDALIPPDPAAAGTSAGGYGIRPYGQRQNAAANRETATSAL